MKKRLYRYFIYMFIRYIPGTSKLTSLEARRLSKYLIENFDEHQQIVILEEIKHNLIIYREQQIINQKDNIENQKKYLVRLERNLITLSN